MLRERLQAALKSATERTDEQAAATLRLVLAAVRERDHCAREAGARQGVGDGEIEQLGDDADYVPAPGGTSS